MTPGQYGGARPRLVIIAALVLIGIGRGRLTPVRAGTGTSLGPPLQQRSFAAAFVANRGSLPTFSNGYLSSHLRTVAPGSGSDIFETRVSDGNSVGVRLWIPGASLVRIEGTAVTPQGSVLVIGSSTTAADPRGLAAEPGSAMQYGRGKQVTNFVAEMALDGAVIRITDLGQEYMPERVCASPDTSYWVLGQNWAEAPPKAGQIPPSYDLLRHYDASGKVLGTYLPRSAVAKVGQPDYHEHRTISSPAFLSCGQTSTAAYVLRQQLGFLLVEADLATGKAQQHVIASPNGMAITSFALSRANTMYATFTSTLAGAKRSFASPTGLWVLSPSRGSSAWQLLGLAPAVLPFSTILGMDGSRLVHLSGAVSPLSDPTVRWTNEPQLQ